MELLLALLLLAIPFFWPILTGLMALSFNRKFWVWFFIGIPLPFIAMIIILCLPDKTKNKTGVKVANTTPVPNEEIFNHLTDDPGITHKKDQHETYFSTSA